MKISLTLRTFKTDHLLQDVLRHNLRQNVTITWRCFKTVDC